MTLLSGLADALGAALAPLAQDGVLHAATLADTGQGGVTASTVDIPVKLLVEGLSAGDRIGLPRNAVRLMVLQASLGRVVALDDSITAAGTTFRVIQVDSDPAGASAIVVGVPA